jgi:hypothetical protein
MPKPGNRRHQFWGQIGRNCRHRFWGKTGENQPSGFEAKPLTNRPSGFEVKPLTNRRSWLAQPRNPRFSSLCARCRPHIASPNLPIARPSSTRPVRPSTVLCIRSPTPATIVVAARHAAPATCTPWDKQMRFSTWNKDKYKTTEISQIQIQTLPSQWLITIKLMN